MTAPVQTVPAPDRGGAPMLWFLPNGVLPQRGPDGRPAAVVAGIGDHGHLQLGVRLGPDPVDVEALRRNVAASAGGPLLGPPPVGVDTVEVLLSTDPAGGDEPVVLATARPDPTYPCAAVLSVPLLPAEHRAVVRAIGGMFGVLAVRYAGLHWEPWVKGPTTTSFTWSSTTTRIGERLAGDAWTRSATGPPPDLPDLPDALTADVAGWFGGDDGLVRRPQPPEQT